MLNQSKLNLWINIAPLIISAAMVLFILIFYSTLPPKLPLFYSLSWGENQLGTPLQILIIPASIIALSLLNRFLSWQLHFSQIFFKKILIYSSLLITLIFIITFLKIILIFI